MPTDRPPIRSARLAAISAAIVLAAPLRAELPEGVAIERLADGFDEPWAIALLPDGALMVTERAGSLQIWRDGARSEVAGLPKLSTQGQGGLLDVTLARDFATSRRLYLTYAKPQGRGSGTALAAARLSDDETALEGLEVLFEMSPGSSGGRHFGSRVVEAEDGRIFVTLGERGEREAAQDLSRHNGSVVRIDPDGSVPSDNPFVDRADALAEIWSYGHRNIQGAGLDKEGRLWIVEHGAKGGDEVNLVRKGRNYGWPVISYGTHYSGAKIGVGTEQEGMEQPAFYWDPSIAPSGLIVYRGAMFPQWQGDIFVGSLKFDYISRLEADGDATREVEQISAPETGRVRDLAEAPDGSILFLSVTDGAVYRLFAN
ncbi:PQQ-dependent sugar dehydrogenase [Sulfitobacter sp. LCG007]